MNRNRRDILKGGSRALPGGGPFRCMDKIDGMQSHPAGNSLAEIAKSRGSGSICGECRCPVTNGS